MDMCFTEPDSTNGLLQKYSIKECQVVLQDVKLDKSLKIINGTVTLPSSGRRKHICFVCNKKFFTPKELNKHRRVHEDSNAEDFVAKNTKKPTSVKKSPKNMKNTIKNYFKKVEKEEHHTSSHRCETCDTVFTSVEKIKRHPSNKCRFVCGVCERSYNTMYAFTVHVLQHKINLFKPEEAPEKLHKCSACPESFDDYIDLKTHGIVVHKTNSQNSSKNNNEDDEISCELCFDIFDSQRELTEHMELHKQLGDKPDSGKVTGNNSSDVPKDETNLQNEELDIEEDSKAVVECISRPAIVELNPIPIIESSYSLAGQEEDLPQNSVDDISPRNSEDSPPGNVENLPQNNVKTRAPNNVAEEEAGYDLLPPNEKIPKKQYKCKKCDRIYLFLGEYRDHLSTACRMKNVCAVCQVKVDSNDEWFTHVNNQHQKVCCKYCFETFTEIRQLEQHTLQKHLSSYKNICKICFKCFISYEKFDEHLRKEHLNM